MIPRRMPGEKIKRPYHLDRMIRNYRYDAHVKSMGLMQIVQNNVNAAIERTEKLRQATTPERPPEEVLTTDGNYTEEQADGLAWPPGFMGEVARNMYKASLLPIKDISILSALALFSGMCGKAWNTVTRSGLNNYFVLIARSGIGKEAFRSNIETILFFLKYPIMAVKTVSRYLVSNVSWIQVPMRLMLHCARMS
ncbi:hypothetical protein HdK1rev_00083 [Escherichia phage vB_EcoS_HdK1]|nr:hypothetical protein HdK1rev_00083 [Escherichia phage vB_EcoS_HdK1]